MKYGRIIYGINRKQSKKFQYANIGDWFQTFAIDEIYRKMGIKADQIVNIDRSNLCNYDGEKIIVPMQGWFGHIKGKNIFPLSPQIEPVFFGFHSVDSLYYKPLCINTYAQYQPIGCRDEPTYNMMRAHKLDAFISGCMTLLLPAQEKKPSNGKVFLVDAPFGVLKYIPKSLRSNVEVITQEVPVVWGNSDAEETDRLEKLSKNLLERYRNEAIMVVTSRLHCASPCLGMGIPVILARNYFDERYSWIDKYLPLYSKDSFSSINWDIKPLDLSVQREKLYNMAEQMLRECAEDDVIRDIHQFYLDRKRYPIHTPFVTKTFLSMHKVFPKTTDFIREKLLHKFTVATCRDQHRIMQQLNMCDLSGTDTKK